VDVADWLVETVALGVTVTLADCDGLREELCVWLAEMLWLRVPDTVMLGDDDGDVVPDAVSVRDCDSEGVTLWLWLMETD
jgi:hypothetical protein